MKRYSSVIEIRFRSEGNSPMEKLRGTCNAMAEHLRQEIPDCELELVHCSTTQKSVLKRRRVVRRDSSNPTVQ